MTSTLLNHSVLLAAAATLSLAGLVSSATAADAVRGAGPETIEHSYGRAGGPIGADVVAETLAWDEDGPAVTIAYSTEVAHWTNMPREQAHEGPVTSAPAQTQAVDHWFGRAGGPVGADEIELMKALP